MRNVRIEKLWGDVQQRCTSRYMDLFDELKSEGLLSETNPIDIWCLHFVYLPILQDALAWFVDYWNAHPLRTEHSKTPSQMWQQSECRQSCGLDRIRNSSATRGSRCKLTSDREDAEAQGVWPVQDAEEILYQRHLDAVAEDGDMRFEDYGTDNYGRDQPLEPLLSDPMVTVDPPSSRLAPSLAAIIDTVEFKSTLRARLGTSTDVDDSISVQQYRTCLSVVYGVVNYLRLRAPGTSMEVE